MRHVRWVLLGSLTLNLGLGGLLVGRWLARRHDPPRPASVAQSGWLHRPAVEAFARVPRLPGATVFVGDSLIAEGPWSELLLAAPLLNRGLKGDTTADVLARLSEIVDRRPQRVVLLVGINDLISGRSPNSVARDVKQVAENVRAQCPEARVTVISLLPTRDPALNARVRHVNAELASSDLDLVDACRALQDADGLLRSEFARDEVHLTTEGYVALVALLPEDFRSGRAR